MKRRTKELTCLMGSVKLYLDDIRELVRVMQQASDEGELKIESEDYEFANVEELADLKEAVLHNLMVSYGSWSSSVRVSIQNQHVFLTSEKDTPTHQGVYGQVKELLESRRRGWNWLSQTWAYVVAGVLGAGGPMLVIFGAIEDIPLLSSLGVGMAMVNLAFWAASGATRKLRKSVIVLEEQGEQESFWQRNRDRIALVLITAFATMVFSVIGTLMVLAITGENPFLVAP